ncbi:MAG: hypothetical protein IGS48_11680 [Oscillatoriales cyanobacterium C42_A2020_001]|nr:hypothetical protein [Leptolyngbyaceae cyanobacterium C42_A2020_001]
MGERTTIDQALVTGDDVLIGQVVLEKLDLLADCPKKHLLGNAANSNYPVAIIE